MEQERRAQLPGVPDLFLPIPGCFVFIQKRITIKHADTARWTGTEWIFKVAYEDGRHAWIKETPEEGTYEELEDQPSEEPNQTVSRTAGPVSG